VSVVNYHGDPQTLSLSLDTDKLKENLISEKWQPAKRV